MYILKRQIFFPTLIFLSTLAYFFFITLTIWHNIPVNVHTHICVSSISEYGFHDISNTDFLFIAVLSRAWHTLHSKNASYMKKGCTGISSSCQIWDSLKFCFKVQNRNSCLFTFHFIYVSSLLPLIFIKFPCR